MQNRSAKVDSFMDALEHPLSELAQEIRLAILRAEPSLNERIKWHAPSFFINDVDRVTFNLKRPDRIHLIFHRGAKPVEDEVPFQFDDPSSLLSMITPERGQVIWTEASAYRANESAFLSLVHRWVRA